MKKYAYGFLVMLLSLASIDASAQGKGWIPWPAVEDTMYIPAGTDTLNKIIVADTAGTGWQGAAGKAAWAAGTRVYVLQPNQTYLWNNQIQIKTANRAFRFRSDYDNTYHIPSNGNLSIDWKPRIVGVVNAAGALPGYFFNLGANYDTVLFRNIAVSDFDEVGSPNTIDIIQGNMFASPSGGGTHCSVYFDSCVVNHINGGFFTFYQDCGTVRIQNSIFADGGFLGMSNLGAGKLVDLRGSQCDTLDVENNTLFNFYDKLIRHISSLQPIHNFIFDHNTLANCADYSGMFDIGWIDSTGVGTFKITNNLFLDNFAFGADTDKLNRQQDFNDNPDKDINGLGKLVWICARPAGTGHTPWVMAKNYYAVSDSGNALLNADYPSHPVHTYKITEDRILTSDLKTQLINNGGDTLLAFQKINITMTKIPPLMTKLIRWYWSPFAADANSGSSTTVAAGNAGAGKLKTGSSGTPATNFLKLTGNQLFARWPYDMNRRSTDWIFDSLNCNFNASMNLATAGTDGKVIGSTMWTFGSLITSVNSASGTEVPESYSLSQNYPNPFNPTTQFQINVKERGLVQVKIFDILGREVATLVNEVKEVGSTTLTWNAAAMSSGVYFYQLKAGNFVDTKKMVLLK